MKILCDIPIPPLFCRYICMSHHVMSGEPYVTCGSDYQWQGEGPVCTVSGQEEVTASEETVVFDTANGDTNGKTYAYKLSYMLFT